MLITPNTDNLDDSKINQDGWDLVYTWSNNNRLEKLTMTRSSNIGSIDIRLVFDRPND